ncbi:MAG: DUF642 domain-containing protein [Patescibacteria group bacterium]
MLSKNIKKTYSTIFVLIVSLSFTFSGFAAVPVYAADEVSSGQCVADANMILNSGFELPVVDNPPGNWTSVPVGDPELLWTSNDAGYPYVEIQAGYTEYSVRWLPHSGVQYAEIDGGTSHDVSQVLNTIPGYSYSLSFWSTPRPNQPESVNIMDISVDGQKLDTLTASGTDMTNWSQHTYTFTATATSTRVSFNQGQTTSIGEGTFLDDVSVICDPESLPPTSLNFNVVASKIVCDFESDLPNWGLGGPDINASTTSEFLNSHSNCHLEPGWSFQWANDTTADPGHTFIGEAAGWNTFGPTDGGGITTTSLSLSSDAPYVWVREVLKDNYLPFTFTYPSSGDNNAVSAEMYCSVDVLNYDNYDRIDGPLVSGATYYCVAFNAETSTVVSDVPVPPPTPPVPPIDNGGGGGGGGIGGHRRDISNLLATGGGEILGATSCSYLRDYLKIDWQNDKIEVLKLQSFLNVFEKENLSYTGIYNQATFDAVSRFQTKYSEDILEPWGPKVTKGFTYILTKKKVNEIYCNTIIPVTQTEQNEIDAFKSSGASVYNGIGQSTENSGQDQNQGISIENTNLEAESIPVVNLTSSSSNDSVIKNVAISLFALPQKIFSDWKYLLVFLILVAIIVAIVRLFRDSGDGHDDLDNPISAEEIPSQPIEVDLIENEESPVIILPSASALPDEEIVIENPEEEPEEIIEEKIS